MARNRFLEAKPGVSVVGVRAGGPAATAQPPIVAGDLIESIEGQPITQAKQLVEKAPPVAELNDQLTYVLAVSRRGKKLLSVITPAPKRLIPEQPPELTKAWAGWEVQPIPAALATRLKLSANGGFRVTRVYADSPAAKAGVAVGDLITATNGIAVSPSGLLETVALDQRVRNASLKEPFQVQLLRANEKRSIEMMLTEQPIDTERAERTWVNTLSMVVRDLTFYDRVDRNLAEQQRGVLVERIENGGFAGLAHLRSGDLLVRVNDAEIGSVDDLGAQLTRLEQSAAPKLSFLVLRGADTRLLFVDSPWAGER
jgi:S1-C subfamily serine protease